MAHRSAAAPVTLAIACFLIMTCTEGNVVDPVTYDQQYPANIKDGPPAGNPAKPNTPGGGSGGAI